MKITSILIAIVVAAVLLVLSGALYTVDETEQVIITQFGKPVGEPVTEAGCRRPFRPLADNRPIAVFSPLARRTQRTVSIGRYPR